MLSIGWPEMLIVAAAALIIVGPRDLPTLLRNIGRVAGQARRMGNEFRAEINKVAALDDVKDIKRSITQPLKDTRSEIESEFNKMTPTGFEPSGKLKPDDPQSESVYDQIKAATANIEEKQPTREAAAKASMETAVATAEQRKAETKAAEAKVSKPRTTGSKTSKAGTSKAAASPAKSSAAKASTAATKTKPAAKKTATPKTSTKAAAKTTAKPALNAKTTAARKPRTTKA